MSDARGSNAYHKEDDGLVYSSIRNDGVMIHWCDKCHRIWISKEEPEPQFGSTGAEVKRERKLDQREIDEVKAQLKKFSLKYR